MNILWDRTFKMLALKVFIYVFCFHYVIAQFDKAGKIINAVCIAFEVETLLIYCGNDAVLKIENPIMAVVHRTLVATAKSCMKNVNGTETDIEYLRKDPPYPEKSSCILKCLLEKIGIVNKNKYSKEGFMTAVMPLVFKHTKKLEHMKSVSENCEKEVNHQHENNCMLGNEITMCIYKYAPELQFNKKIH